MLDRESERALLLRAQAGDAGAFDRLVATHGRLVLSLARRITASGEDAEDVAQEVFLRFYRTIDRVDAERPLEPWLVRLTLNASRSHRSRTPRRREEQLSEQQANIVSADKPGDALEAADFRKGLTLALAELSRREREVFLLRDREGLEVATIAESLGISAVTVRRQSTEARRKLAAWFRKNRPDLLPPRKV